MILGLSGKAGSGKDTMADFLVTRYGFEKASFAYALKSLCVNLGWNGQKDEAGRKLLQDLGTVLRTYDKDFWLRPVVSYIAKNPHKHIVITDVRHINEAQAVKNIGGKLIRIDRENAYSMGILQQHESELALDKYTEFDKVIYNDGGFDELFSSAIEFVHPFMSGK